MDLLSKGRLFGSYSLVYGKTHKVLSSASEYLPRDFSALIKVLDKSAPSVEASEILAEDFVINSFYKGLYQKLAKPEFNTWRLAMKAAVISKSINKWINHAHYKETFLAALVRDLPIMVLRNEVPRDFKDFELKMIEGKTVEEASMLTFGINLEEYVKLFAKHFNYSFVEEKQEQVIDSAYQLAESFSNPDQKASSLWIESQAQMQKLGLEMTEDQWADRISSLYVKVSDLDHKFK